MEYNILQSYSIEDEPIEFKIQIENVTLLVIYGRHINGYFIAVPTAYVCCSAIEPQSVDINTIYLSQAGLRSDYARIICESIKSEWERIWPSSKK